MRDILSDCQRCHCKAPELKRGKITDSMRLEWLWRHLPFEERHKYGGDENEMRQGIDVAASWATWDDEYEA